MLEALHLHACASSIDDADDGTLVYTDPRLENRRDAITGMAEPLKGRGPERLRDVRVLMHGIIAL